MSLHLEDDVGFEEPAHQASASTASSDSNAVVISNDLTRVQNSLTEFDRVSAGIAELEARYPKDAIYPVGTSKGMKDALEHRAAYRDPRYTVEKARKMAKAPLTSLGKSIDARAAWITEKLREGEDPVDKQIKAEEARKEEERQARLMAEIARTTAIQEALAEIGQDVLIACGKTSVEVQALLADMQERRPEQKTFQEMIEQANAAWDAGIAKLETTLKAKLWDEAEQTRTAEARAAEEARHAEEAAKIEAQRVENERIAAAQAAEAQRIADERAAFEAERAAFKAQQEAAAAAQTPNTPEQATQQVLKADPETGDATGRGESAYASPDGGPMGAEQPAAAGLTLASSESKPAERAPTMTIGEINRRLAPIQIDTRGMVSLGFALQPHSGASSRFLASDWPRMCEVISKTVADRVLHIEAA